MIRTKALVKNLLMSKFYSKSNREHKLRILKIVILNTKWKDCKSRKNLYTKNFMYTKKFYVHENAAVNLSKIYPLKNAKKTCKPNNRHSNRDWINKTNSRIKFLHRKNQFLTPVLRRLLCNALIQPHFYYASSAWYTNLTQKMKNKIQITQNKWIR